MTAHHSHRVTCPQPLASTILLSLPAVASDQDGDWGCAVQMAMDIELPSFRYREAGEMAYERRRAVQKDR